MIKDNPKWFEEYEKRVKRHGLSYKHEEDKYLTHLSELCHKNPRIKNILLSGDDEIVRQIQAETEAFFEPFFAEKRRMDEEMINKLSSLCREYEQKEKDAILPIETKIKELSEEKKKISAKINEDLDKDYEKICSEFVINSAPFGENFVQRAKEFHDSTKSKYIELRKEKLSKLLFDYSKIADIRQKRRI